MNGCDRVFQHPCPLSRNVQCPKDDEQIDPFEEESLESEGEASAGWKHVLNLNRAICTRPCSGSGALLFSHAGSSYFGV